MGSSATLELCSFVSIAERARRGLCYAHRLLFHCVLFATCTDAKANSAREQCRTKKPCSLDSCETSRCMTLVPPCCSGCHLLHSGIIGHTEFIQRCFSYHSGEERSLRSAL